MAMGDQGEFDGIVDQRPQIDESAFRCTFLDEFSYAVNDGAGPLGLRGCFINHGVQSRIIRHARLLFDAFIDWR